MENAVEALKIVFAIFVFILAITITFSLIASVKSTSDVVFYHNDKTNFYSHSVSSKKREISIEEIISMLYRYYKESIAIEIKFNDPRKDVIFDLSRESSSISEIENELNDFIDKNLLKLDEKSLFTEEFVEVPCNGIYNIGEDGTEIIEEAGIRKLYITYTQV